jgi:hypothetical protein
MCGLHVSEEREFTPHLRCCERFSRRWGERQSLQAKDPKGPTRTEYTYNSWICIHGLGLRRERLYTRIGNKWMVDEI